MKAKIIINPAAKRIIHHDIDQEVRKICKLIGALRLAGVEEFTLRYSYGEIRCSAEMDISEVEDG